MVQQHQGQRDVGFLACLRGTEKADWESGEAHVAIHREALFLPGKSSLRKTTNPKTVLRRGRFPCKDAIMKTEQQCGPW